MGRCGGYLQGMVSIQTLFPLELVEAGMETVWETGGEFLDSGDTGGAAAHGSPARKDTMVLLLLRWCS